MLVVDADGLDEDAQQLLGLLPSGLDDREAQTHWRRTLTSRVGGGNDEFVVPGCSLSRREIRPAKTTLFVPMWPAKESAPFTTFQ